MHRPQQCRQCCIKCGEAAVMELQCASVALRDGAICMAVHERSLRISLAASLEQVDPSAALCCRLA